jgi:hypothetical protein
MSVAILVLGMHRSGTSAMAGALARLGVPLGESLIDGAEDNPTGFFEHREIVSAHDELGLRYGRTWDDPRPAAPDLHTESARAALAEAMGDVLARDFGDAPLWALKDPRMCRFLPAWLDLLDAGGIDFRCLLTLRAPADVAASLSERNGFSEEKSAALWLDHVLESVRGSRDRGRTRACFDELLDDPAATLARCGEELGVRWPRPPAAAADELRELVRPELRHHRGVVWDPLPTSLAGLAEEVWQELRAADEWPTVAALDAWHQAYSARFDAVAPLILEHATQVAERAARDHQWMTERALHRDLEPLLTDLEGRLAKVIAELAEEVAKHSGELTRQGEATSALEARINEHQGAFDVLLQRIEEAEEPSAGSLAERLRRLLGRRG